MRNNALYCSSVCSPVALFNQEGSVINQKQATMNENIFPVILGKMCDCFYYCCDINLLSCCHIYHIYRIALFCTCICCLKNNEHSEPLVATTTTKAHVINIVCKYFSHYCIHRRGISCRTFPPVPQHVLLIFSYYQVFNDMPLMYDVWQGSRDQILYSLCALHVAS